MIPLCDQTVTIYFSTERELIRQVVTGCCCQWEQTPKESILGTGGQTKFRLILPGKHSIAPGDYVARGIGPEGVVFPEQIPGVARVEWVRDFFHSVLPHTEAGN